MASYRHDDPDKLVVDSIHGDIHLTQREREVIDTGSFQRLRYLKQLAMSQMAYPNATHTRFAHSLGVFAIMTRIVEIAKKTGQIVLSHKEEEDLRLAALLHDVGHYPYSHLMERIDKVKLIEEQVKVGRETKLSLDRTGTPYPEHDLVGTFIVTEQDDLLEALGGKRRAKVIANLFGPKRPTENVRNLQLSKLVHSSLDMDRLDYLLRDSQATGVPYGQIDINYLLNNLKVSPSGMVGISEKAVPAAEQFLFARFFMHRTVYYHKTTFGMEEVCRQLLRRLRDQGKYEMPRDAAGIRRLVTSDKLGTFTDAYVDGIIQESTNNDNEVIQTLARSMQGRRPPKRLREINILRSTDDPNEHHAGTTFKMNCRHNLSQLAGDFDIPLEHFILCETPPLRLEKRARLVSAEEAGKIDGKDEEELIKVFVSGEEEPKSLVDISHSLISRCAGLSFQSFRLYVIQEDTTKGEVLAQLREKVKNWDKT
ncbi:MAG: HD domain-containing protein [Sedimentisphaerales bacterium]|nr:HD domain-containing protein [Sedimentisphaerales bacterium]